MADDNATNDETTRRAYISGLLRAVNIQPPAKRIEKTADIFPNGLPDSYDAPKPRNR